jgi:hypothetical protein
MAHAIRELKAIQRSGCGDLSRAVSRLRKQQKESRRAGCAPMVCLCQTVADYLALEEHAAGGRSGKRPSKATVVAVLLDACRAIRQYADTVEKTAAYLDGRGRSPDSDSWTVT